MRSSLALISWGMLISLIAATLVMPARAAQVNSQDYELVYNAPRETSLAVPDLTDTSDAWRSLIDSANDQLDIAEFYVVDESPSRLSAVIDRLKAAGERGVHIRLLVENGVDLSAAKTLRQLRAIPNLTLKQMAYRDVGGGIMHAKYMIADGRLGYIGSANFDWRSLTHIQETGLLIRDQSSLAQMQAIFAQDWSEQARLGKGEHALPVDAPSPRVPESGNFLVASPRRFNPPGVVDSEDALRQLIASARQRIRVQVMTYSPLGFAPEGQPQPYYPLIDQALREAASRGVHIELIVANWSLGENRLPWLKSLAMVPNVAIRAVTVPPSSQGHIPYARVIHSKFMTIDSRIAWVGTSNWDGGYLDTSRNLEVVMHDSPMATRLDRLFSMLWSSEYANPLRASASD